MSFFLLFNKLFWKEKLRNYKLAKTNVGTKINPVTKLHWKIRYEIHNDGWND